VIPPKPVGWGLGATAAALIMFTAWGAPASAQSSFIPSLIGQTVADQMQAQRAEEACRAGAPPDPAYTGDIKATVLTVFAIFWRERSDEDRKPLAGYFAVKRSDVDIDVGKRAAGPDAVKAFFADPGAIEPGADAFDPPAPKSLVIAGDYQSVAAVWELPDHRWYSADFIRQRGRWLFVHLDAGAPGSAPPALAQYCHVRGDVGGQAH
jgi:hypothetical protein